MTTCCKKTFLHVSWLDWHAHIETLFLACFCVLSAMDSKASSSSATRGLQTTSAASSSTRAEKLRRLNLMRKKLPYMSAASLSGVLKDVEEHGTPGLHQQKHIKEARASYKLLFCCSKCLIPFKLSHMDKCSHTF